MPPISLPHKKVIRKRETPFKRFHSHRYVRVGEKWRRPRGIDNPMRRHYKGMPKMPKIGFRTDKKTRFMDKNGFIRVNYLFYFSNN
jgi:large subunit ribosomal protein L32e